MKIVYICEERIDRSSGVLSKINAQIREWENNGIDVHVWLFSGEEYELANCFLKICSSKVKVFRRLSPLYPQSLNRFINKVNFISEIAQALKGFNADAVYLRELLWFPGISQLFKVIPVVVESNTLFIEEAKVGNPIRYCIAKLFQKKIYQNAAGVIGVTTEISKSVAVHNKTVITISNGIDLRVPFGKPSVCEDKKIRVIFVGTPGYPWHGVDLYYELASLIPYAEFHLVGDMMPTDEVRLANFVQHGYLNTEQLSELYQTVDIAVGTLALFRKQMEEACTLKVREYLAYGLPTIIGHYDPDLVGLKFVLQIPNRATGVRESLEEIKRFLADMKGKRLHRADIQERISLQVKEKLRLEFIRKVVR